MRYQLLVGAIVIVVLLIIYTIRQFKRNYGLVTVQYDGKGYSVRNQQGKEEVAAVLAALESRLNTFTQYLGASQYRDNPKVMRILNRWSGCLAETSPMYDGDAAYTTDKKAISICIRNVEGDIEDQNSAMYVAIHEMAHVATHQYGHPPDFWATFRFLLNLAVEQSLYIPSNGSSKTYCGTAIDDNEYQCLQNGTCKAYL